MTPTGTAIKLQGIASEAAMVRVQRRFSRQAQLGRACRPKNRRTFTRSFPPLLLDSTTSSAACCETGAQFDHHEGVLPLPQGSSRIQSRLREVGRNQRRRRRDIMSRRRPRVRRHRGYRRMTAPTCRLVSRCRIQSQVRCAIQPATTGRRSKKRAARALDSLSITKPARAQPSKGRHFNHPHEAKVSDGHRHVRREYDSRPTLPPSPT